MARLAHARGAGAWFSASPRVQRLVAAHVVVVLGAALAAVGMQPRPDAGGDPLALAAATGPASAPVQLAADPLQVHAPPAVVSRAATTPRPTTTTTPKPKPHPKPTPPPPRGWAFWSTRIRGCESGDGPNAPPDYKAKNPTSSASGAYQILDSTWGGRYGVRHASDATPEQQETVAAELYRRHGTADWAASAACWRR